MEAAASVTAVYCAYAELMRVARVWLGGDDLGGRLLLVVPGAAEGMFARDALVRGSSIAGGASLVVEPDAASARALVRSGVCDFLVTTLSEGLRILKNEVRRREAASVCVLEGAAALLGECVERGLQPDLLAMEEPILVARGSVVVRGPVAALGGAGMQLVQWSAPAPAVEALRRVDALALRALVGGDVLLRRRWLARSAGYLERSAAAGHSLAMNEVEREQLMRDVREAMHAGELPTGMTVRLLEE